jgi:hypothetical protein
MPLLFQSLNHGEVPFGFFNIETDMVLLSNYFFFASDLCRHVTEIAGTSSGNPFTTNLDGYILENSQIGNLMGSIAGVDLCGFIGEVYNEFPFPHEPDKFKQNPEGHLTRGLVEGIMRRYTGSSPISVAFDGGALTVKVGEYLFGREGFHGLLTYLWAGGYPKWKDGKRPDYVLAMKDMVERSSHPLFGFQFPDS